MSNNTDNSHKTSNSRFNHSKPNRSSENSNRRTERSDRQEFNRPSRADKYNDPDAFFVCGLHPVEEAVTTLPDDTIRASRLYIAESREQKEIADLLKLCEQKGLKPAQSSMQELTRKAGETRHQGVLLELPKFKYTELDAVLENLSPQPLILVLDQIQDPHNLGAIIRSAAAFGADAVVIPRDRAAQITATSLKTSAGQAYKLPICRVSNIAQTLRQLKELDFNVVGADIDGCVESEINYHRATALVMGSEGDGMRRLTRTLCDQMVRIAQNPAVESLNVSVAAAILLYTASKQRKLNW